MAVLAPVWIPGLLGALILAILVAMVVRWIKLPYTIALVLVGLVIGLLGDELPAAENFQGLLSAEVIFFLLLPPLLFEGASAMDLGKLSRNWKMITLLAIPGVVISTFSIGIITWQVIWPDVENGLLYGLLLGSILAATDPVSVLALFKTLGAPKRLSILVEGESLFNDGTAVVLFNILLLAVLATLVGQDMTAGELLISGFVRFLYIVTIGFLVGFVGGILSNWLLIRTKDHLVEISITVALAFGTFLLAELMHGSGVIAVVIGGLLVGNHGTKFGMTATARVGLRHFWEVVSFLINSVLFLLIGYEVQAAFEFDMRTLLLASTAIIAVTFARFIIYPLIFISNRKHHNPIPWNWRHTIFWSGLRGSIPIALLLLLANMVTDGTSFELSGTEYTTVLPEWLFNDMLVMAFSVVLWTLLIQGLTLKPLMTKLKVIGNLPENEVSYGIALAESIATRAALERLAELQEVGMVSNDDRELLQNILIDRLDVAETSVSELSHSSKIHSQRMESTRMELLMAQLSSINEASNSGLLQESVAEHAISALLENLHQSQEKQEEKGADIAERTTTGTSSEEDETGISPETFEQLAPPEVEELLEIEGSLESE